MAKLIQCWIVEYVHRLVILTILETLKLIGVDQLVNGVIMAIPSVRGLVSQLVPGIGLEWMELPIVYVYLSAIQATGGTLKQACATMLRLPVPMIRTQMQPSFYVLKHLTVHN